MQMFVIKLMSQALCNQGCSTDQKEKHSSPNIHEFKKPTKNLNFGTIDQSATSIQFDSQSKAGVTFCPETFLV